MPKKKNKRKSQRKMISQSGGVRMEPTIIEYVAPNAVIGVYRDGGGGTRAHMPFMFNVSEYRETIATCISDGSKSIIDFVCGVRVVRGPDDTPYKGRFRMHTESGTQSPFDLTYYVNSYLPEMTPVWGNGVELCAQCKNKRPQRDHAFCGRTCATQYQAAHRGGTTDQPFIRPPNSYTDPNKYFYEKKYKLYELANFAPYSIDFNQTVYPTSEHLFQMLKFSEVDRTQILRWISDQTPFLVDGQQHPRTLDDPMAIFQLTKGKLQFTDGSTVPVPVEQSGNYWHIFGDSLATMFDPQSIYTGLVFYDWWPEYKPSYKDLAMYFIVYIKFTTHPYLRYLLIKEYNSMGSGGVFIEYSHRDHYWGVANWIKAGASCPWSVEGAKLVAQRYPQDRSRGGNHLGQILTVVAKDLINPGAPNAKKREAIRRGYPMLRFTT